MLTNFSSEICHWWEKLVFKASCQKAFRKSGELVEKVYQRQKGRRGSKLHRMTGLNTGFTPRRYGF